MRFSPLMQKLHCLDRRIGTRIRELFQLGKRRQGRRSIVWASQLAPAAEVLEDRALLSALTVNSTADNIDADTVLTLREAILLVNNGGNSMDALGRDLTPEEMAQIDETEPFGTNDSIRFDDALEGGTITLGGTELAITVDVAIMGFLGDNQLTIDADGLSRIFFVDGDDDNQITVAISGLTLTGGVTEGSGGAIVNFENLTISNSTLSENFAFFDGGGIINLGDLTITNSTLSENFAGRDGGGIENSGTLTITNSTLEGNIANLAESEVVGFGGGINNFLGTVMVQDSTLTLNTALDGGGINNFRGVLTVTTSSLSKNSAKRDGGGIENSGTLTVTNSTLSQNTADRFGGGIDNFEGTATIIGTTIVSNTALDGGGIENIEGVLTITGSSIISQNSAARFGGGIDNFLGTVTVTGSIIFGNSSALDGGGIENIGGVLTITNSTISQNTADQFGGGIDNFFGTVTIAGSSIVSNTAGFDGGGIENFGGDMTILDSTISQNVALDLGGGIDNFGTLTLTNSHLQENVAGFGGGIFNFGELTVTSSTLQQNAADLGGGIGNEGNLTVMSSTLSQNTADFAGGGIFNEGNLTVMNSTLSQNFAGFDGGGIFNFDQLTLFASTLSQNFAGFDGGGIFSFGTTRVTNSTLSQNSANGDGGGISNFDALTVLSSATLFGNRADADGNGTGTGGGIWTFDDEFTFTEVFNTIVAGNLQGTQGTPNDIANKNVEAVSTNNLIGDPLSAGGLVHGLNRNIVGDGMGNPINIHAVLDTELRDNGGPTETHALILRSPAINAGEPPPMAPPPSREEGKTFTMLPEVQVKANRPGRDGMPQTPTPPASDGGGNIMNLMFDQRGPNFFRVTGGRIDIGAFEFQFHIDLAIGSGGGINGTVQVFSSEFTQQPFRSLTPYSRPATELEPAAIFQGSVRVALGDVTGDGFNDIITAAGPGGGPHVKVFSGRTFEELAAPLGSFFAYDPQFLGGVYVAAADLNGDGRAEIITGAGEGGGPHVRTWNGADGALMFNFFAYDPLFSGGVRVAAGDITGNGRPDIITGAGPGGGPHVRVFDGSAPQPGALWQNIGGPLGSFFAYEINYTGGVFVSANNTGLPGGALIVTGSDRRIGGTSVGIFRNSGAARFQQPLLTTGVTVATFDFNRDGINDYLVATGPGVSGRLRIISGDNSPPPFSNILPFGPTLLDIFPFGENYGGGLFVAASTANPGNPHLTALDTAFASLPLTDWE